MAILDMVLHGDPVAKGRPRTGNGRTYTPARTRDAENAIKVLVQHELGNREPTKAPIGIAVEFYCATARRSDGDNLLKLVTDAMNGLVYADDSQILEYFCRVHRSVGKDAARTEVLVYELDEAGAGPLAPLGPVAR